MDYMRLLLLLFLANLVQVESQAINETLVLVNAIFRHGDRNPERNNLYPSSPYYDENFYAPHGYGQLTNKGTLTAYRLGTALRQRYSGFLEEAYNIKLLEARSTDFNRTKESLQAVLAGLFPPTAELTWLEGMNWLPISYTYVERQFDKEMFPYGCPNWSKTFDAYLATEVGTAFTNKYNATFRIISQNTGRNYTEILPFYYMYFGFLIQEQLGFTLPEWTRIVYPNPLKNIATDFYALMFATPALRKMSGGYLMKKILADTQKKINGTLVPPQRKMFLYSGHENNVASIMKLVNIWDEDEIAPYGAYVLLELHQINGVYGFKLYYQNYNTSEPVLQKMPNCEEFCPLATFISLVQEDIPDDQSTCGYHDIPAWGSYK